MPGSLLRHTAPSRRAVARRLGADVAPVVWAALTVGQFAGLPGRLLDLLQVAVMVMFVLVAWFAATAPGRAARAYRS